MKEEHINIQFQSICYVLQGSGRIIGANKEKVSEGDLVLIPSEKKHYMIPEETPFKILIWYIKKE